MGTVNSTIKVIHFTHLKSRLNLNNIKMKKLKKLSLSQLAQADLNEREMCRLLGGGEPGNCQCGCHYEGQPGGATTSANNSANNALGYHSDPQNSDGCLTHIICAPCMEVHGIPCMY